MLRSRFPIVLAAGCLSILLAGGALAQGLTLGEPDEPDTLDLGAPADPATGTARPTAPTQPPATRPVPQAPAAQQAPAAPTAPTASQRSGAGPLAPQVQDGAALTRETVGAWEVACAENGQCAMAQIGNDGSGTPVLEMVIRKLPEPLEVGERTAIAVLDVVTPLGVVLTDGLGLTIDGGQTEAAPFQICTEQGCLVREPIDQGLIDRLKSGNVARLEIVAANRGPIAADLSLSGFTKGYDTIK